MRVLRQQVPRLHRLLCSRPAFFSSFPSASETPSTFAEDRQRLDYDAASYYSPEPLFARINDQPNGFVCYDEYGDPEGVPVIFCHGNPGSRVIGNMLHRQCLRVGVRLIVPDRPGVGFSPSQEEGGFDAWARLSVQFADAIKLERYSVASWDSGCGWALAAALAAPDRVVSTHLMAAQPPYYGLPKHVEEALAEIDGLHWKEYAEQYGIRGFYPTFLLHRRRVCKKPFEVLGKLETMFENPSDSVLLAAEVVTSTLLDDQQEAFRGGFKGVVEDAYPSHLDWTPLVEQAQDMASPLYVWSGDDDPTCPQPVQQYLFSLFPRAECTGIPLAGHLFLFNLKHGFRVCQAMTHDWETDIDRDL